MRKTWRRGDFFVSAQADKEVPRFFCLLIGLGQAGPRKLFSSGGEIWISDDGTTPVWRWSEAFGQLVNT